MSSYEKFTRLCIERGIKPTRAIEAAGLSRGLGTKWKITEGYIPCTDSIQKLCRYFGVSADYFLLDGNNEAVLPRELSEFAPLIKAALRMTHEQRRMIVKYAMFTYPEAFDEV